MDYLKSKLTCYNHGQYMFLLYWNRTIIQRGDT